jgi:hypothetical protein
MPGRRMAEFASPVGASGFATTTRPARRASAHLLPSSKRFADGAQYRFEIPSVEGHACLAAALLEAERHDVRIHRVSQGSGVFLQTDAELAEFATLAHEAAIEVSLFARPSAGWTSAAASDEPAAGGLAAASQGSDGITDALDDIRRAADHGFRSVLIADLGLLAEFNALRQRGELPPEMQAKVSVMLPIANPATARVLVGLGANTLNLAPYLSLAQIAEIREAVDVPLDVYVEVPDNLGGMIRLHEIPELVRVASPVYVKFGLRNAPDVYPAGSHLESTTVALTRERVRRARLGQELIERSGATLVASGRGAEDLAIPVPLM